MTTLTTRAMRLIVATATTDQLIGLLTELCPNVEALTDALMQRRRVWACCAAVRELECAKADLRQAQRAMSLAEMNVRSRELVLVATRNGEAVSVEQLN